MTAPPGSIIVQDFVLDETAKFARADQDGAEPSRWTASAACGDEPPRSP